MPTSSTEPIIDVIALAAYWKPKSVLDVGCGFGKYGFLLREYLDVAEGRVSPNQWKVRIEAVEVHKPYLSYQHRVYNRVFVGDVRTLPLGKYDLILAADVIEHVNKKEAYKLIDKLLKKCKHLLITTPIGFIKQADGWEKINTYEKHKSGWLPEDFKRYKKARVKPYSQVMLVRIDA